MEMTREEFIKMCGIMGLSLPLQASFSTDGKSKPNNNFRTDFSGKVIIIGAGAGGLATAYFLGQYGIDFEILEASETYGGRMKTVNDFADFPIPLGAEWLHTNPKVFKKIVNNSSVPVDVETVGYDRTKDTVGVWENGRLEVSKLVDSDRKFVNSGWLDFFEKYIIPSVSDKISYKTIVRSVDYSGDQVILNTSAGDYQADKVVISVPLKVLQDGDIKFQPELPSDKSEAITKAVIWDGFKAFMEFSEKFYHTTTSFVINPETEGQKLYYDASYGQDTEKNILGLFVVGKPAQDYISLSGDALREFMLNELDEIYDSKASSSYLKHIVQNWNEEPFIKAAYLTDHENWRRVRTLGKSVADKVYFAGGPYTDGEDWVAVHAAAQSAKTAADEIVK
ncbi:flavin monoamine oxidase family protein [Poritiphilus flavus]|uniref:Tryptophan 2-monooxygenase n=1 Tax=Poritiphilus flavus TaxID=2697053 RepID=A0A6L9EB19_9FLAO|nr:FAD-dependent oxidoreductase [Poritiphilus flavus]NAS11955.1 NAD(P)-binding protein [Poritiphilus flavus]